MSGLEATKLIRAEIPDSKQPIIVALTANAMEGDSDKCYVYGMDGYLAKPLKIENLVAVLQKHGLKRLAEVN